MDADKDEDLMYETLEDLEPREKESPISSTGSISDDDEDEIPTSTNERQRISWSMGEGQSSDRVILKPRRSSEVPLSNFGIELPEKREEISDDQIQDLYDGLGVTASNQQIRPSALFIHALKAINIYEVEKIFAEYDPLRSALLSPKTAVVKFESNLKAAEALIGLTMRLIRVRKESAQEEGELNEEESDGEGEKSKQNYVVIRKDGSRKRKKMANTIELDIDEVVDIPVGNWQVVCKHVPKGRYVFVRFAVGFEVRQSMINPYRAEVSENLDSLPETSNDPGEFSATFTSYKKQRVKPGINVFKEDGTELPWNFEHDTRGYQDPTNEEEQTETPTFESKDEEIVTKNKNGEKIKIRSRGRGCKKFIEALMANSDSE